MDALLENETWELKPLPQDKHAVGCRWVFIGKYLSDGSLEWYKARLIAEGYTQSHGIDYEVTVAPVTKLNTIRILLALVASLNWKINQFDVKNVFLHDDLKEKIYMDLLSGYYVSAPPGTVCHLKKTIYGLKQFGRTWFETLCNAMKSMGYSHDHGDDTLFMKHLDSGTVTIPLVYVDDIIVTGNNAEESKSLSQRLATLFEIKFPGEMRYLLGIEVAYSYQGIFISQQKYILDLLKEMGVMDCKPSSTPIDPNTKLGICEEDSPTN